MAVVGEALLRVRPDTGGFESEVTSKVGGTFRKVAGIAAGAIASAGIAQVLRGTISAAGDFGESLNKVQVVFGSLSGRVAEFAKSAPTALGQTQQQALEAAGTFGNLFKAMGIADDASADMSTSLVKLASDLASFNNVSPEEALDALRSGLTGETEPLKKFGVNLDEATLKAKAMQLGLSDGKGVLDANAKAQASYALILEKTKTAQGDFARTSDGAANRQRILAAQFGELQRQIGTALLPVFNQVLSVMTKLLPAIAPLAPVLVPLAGAIAAIVAVTKVWTIVQAALNVVMAANPVTLVVLAIAALVAGVILAYKNSETFRDIVQGVFEVLKTLAGFIVTGVVGAFNAMRAVITGVFDWVRDHWQLLLAILTGPIGLAIAFVVQNFGKIRDFIAGVIDWIRSHWQLILAILTGPVGLAVKFIVDHFNEIVSFFTSLPGRIVGAIGNLAQTMFNLGVDAMESLGRGLWSLISKIGNIASRIKDELVSKLNPANWFSTPEEHYRMLWGDAFRSIADEGRKSLSGLSATVNAVTTAATPQPGTAALATTGPAVVFQDGAIRMESVAQSDDATARAVATRVGLAAIR